MRAWPGYPQARPRHSPRATPLHAPAPEPRRTRAPSPRRGRLGLAARATPRLGARPRCSYAPTHFPSSLNALPHSSPIRITLCV